MNIEKMREEASAAFKKWEPSGNPAAGVSAHLAAKAAYIAAWIESRAAIEVDLEPDEPADDGAAYLHQDFVKSRIQVHCLKVKS